MFLKSYNYDPPNSFYFYKDEKLFRRCDNLKRLLAYFDLHRKPDQNRG